MAPIQATAQDKSNASSMAERQVESTNSTADLPVTVSVASPRAG
jgi:hypothetical protein